MAVGGGQGEQTSNKLRELRRDRREMVVHDELESCPYLPGRSARLPLRWQSRRLNPAEMDTSLSLGDRRVGRMLYRTRCPTCTSCEPLRIPVSSFVLSRSHKRVLKRNADVVIETGPAGFSEEKLALYNRHKFGRGLSRGEEGLTRIGYEGWFVESCVETLEMSYRVDGVLIGVGIVDVGQWDSSSVYFYFDPEEERRSLGVFSTLMEINWLRSHGGRYHYLGLYVADCRHLSYKATYGTHERLVGGQWRTFDRVPSENGAEERKGEEEP